MQRGVVPVAGVLVLLAITVICATTVGLVVSSPPPEPPPAASFDASVDGAADRIELTHLGGDPIDLTAVTLRITVEGTALAHQPPVPFFAATGFESGPTGPFNAASPNRWRAGERGGLELASTNDPGIAPGDTVRIRILTGTATVADITETASRG